MAATVRKPAKKTSRAKAVPAKKSATRTAAGSADSSAKKAAAKKSAPRAAANGDLTRRMVAAATAACEDKKGFDTRILELDAVDSGFTDFFLITSGANERQTQTIADEVELRLKREFSTYPNSVEGKRLGEWILLDYVDFVVHIFLAEKRAFYDIERLRKSARHIDAEELQRALQKKTATARERVAGRAAAASHTSH
jgi:ribosome-associated protein